MSQPRPQRHNRNRRPRPARAPGPIHDLRIISVARTGSDGKLIQVEFSRHVAANAITAHHFAYFVVQDGQPPVTLAPDHFAVNSVNTTGNKVAFAFANVIAAGTYFWGWDCQPGEQPVITGISLAGPNLTGIPTRLLLAQSVPAFP